MLILAIDTSTRMGSVAVLRDATLLAEISGYEETPYSTRLFRDVALLQDRAAFRLKDVDVFAVAAGPGSFTGLRVGLTAVKAWAEVYRKPIAAVSGLEALAAAAAGNSGIPARAPFLAPFLDARRGQIFGAIYGRAASVGSAFSVVSEGAILSASEFLDAVSAMSAGAVQLISPTPEVLPESELRRALPGASVLRVPAALAGTIGRLALAMARRGDLIDSLALDANYVRRSDAEAAWKDA